ncbi:helix-turn-helix domain-containing protein [Shinella fusca]|uniref:Excisionase family DNA binding protein n=1 Tax=Shinella fusca TaxID=544480 RepID=A0A7W7YZJ5_9HYPH|nr:helix-turn-helix domain-containing protein [Shinella fusca]MBB5045264.1 excisionase family DNA binding protein [Shinella fusca]
MAPLDPNRMMTLEQAADFLLISTRTLRRKIKSGELAAHKFGRLWRIAERDLLAFIEQHRKS